MSFRCSSAQLCCNMFDCHMLTLQGDRWRRAFLQVAEAVGVHLQQGSEPQPDAVLQAVAGLQQSQQRLQVRGCCHGSHMCRPVMHLHAAN
jgi:hypothetical protein